MKKKTGLFSFCGCSYDRWVPSSSPLWFFCIIFILSTFLVAVFLRKVFFDIFVCWQDRKSHWTTWLYIVLFLSPLVFLSYKFVEATGDRFTEHPISFVVVMAFLLILEVLLLSPFSLVVSYFFYRKFKNFKDPKSVALAESLKTAMKVSALFGATFLFLLVSPTIISINKYEYIEPYESFLEGLIWVLGYAFIPLALVVKFSNSSGKKRKKS